MIRTRARRIHLDYVVASRPPRWPGAVVLVVSLAVAAELFTGYRTARMELARLEAAAGMIGPQRGPVRAIPAKRLDEERKSAEAVVRELTLPWGALIRTLEQAATREVAILQLQPDAHQRVVKITAEARNQAAMFEYLRRLGASRNLGEPHLVSHQVQREDPQRPIQFSIQAALR